MNSSSLTTGELQWREQWSDGSRTWLVREPWSLQHYQFTDLQRLIWLQLQQGSQVAQITQVLQAQFPEQRVSSQDVAAFVADLRSAGLSPTTQWGSGRVRYRAAMRSRSTRYHSWWSPWTLRLPLLDPTPWLAPLGSVAAICFSPLAVAVVLITAVLLSVHALGSIDMGGIDWSQWREPNLWLGVAVSLAITKSCHELGHALACRKYRVECHEIGLLFLFLLPCLYCDVSDSWQLRNRWQRMVIALAGIYVELILAILAYAAWMFAVPGTFKSIMLITAVSSSLGTLLINANPLLRYDGYFVLSDGLNWPNLWQDAHQVGRRSIGWCLGIYQHMEFGFGQTIGLLMFALASVGYRLLLTGTLLLGVQQLFPLREHPAIASVLMTGLMLPWLAGSVTLLRTTWTGPRQTWPWRWYKRLVAIGLFAFAVYAFMAIPFTTHITCRATCNSVMEAVYAPTSGTVESVRADGTAVEVGDLLVDLRDFHKEQLFHKLELEVQEAAANLARLQAQEASDATIAQSLPAMRSVLAGKQEQLQLVRSELDRLQVKRSAGLHASESASTTGIWCYKNWVAAGRAIRRSQAQPVWTEVRSARENYIVGAAIEKGTLLGSIRLDAPPVVEVYVPESNLDMLDLSQPVQIRLDYWPGRQLEAEVIEVLPAITTIENRQWLAPQDSLLPIVERDGRQILAMPHFVVRLKLVKAERLLLPQNWATAQLPTPAMSCSGRCWRWLQTTFAR